MNEERRIEVEEVSGVPSPPKARVEDAPASSFERKRDYLEGFLAQQSADAIAESPGGDLYEAVIEALKDIYDPEIPVNIYDLGLIYGVEESMPGEVELRVGAVPGVGDAEVELVWDPPWDPQKMSDEAKLELGML